MATAIDAKDQISHCHVRRVQVYAARMGEIFGLSENEISALKAGWVVTRYLFPSLLSDFIDTNSENGIRCQSPRKPRAMIAFD